MLNIKNTYYQNLHGHWLRLLPDCYVKYLKNDKLYILNFHEDSICINDNIYFNDYLTKLYNEYLNMYWLKHFKNLDLNIKKISIAWFDHPDIIFSKFKIVNYVPHYKIEVCDKFDKLIVYKFYEIYYKKYVDLLQYNIRFNHDTVLNYLNGKNKLKFDTLLDYYTTNNVQLSNKIISLFIEYLLKDKLKYHNDNKTFENFLKNYGKSA